MGKTAGSVRLRSRLLVGVAAAAMAAPVANRALAQDAAKFSPYVEAGGMVGTHSFGDVDIFIPVWQDQTSVLFGDLRGTFSAQPTEEGNFGLGYRTQVSPEWILGGYGYFDIANSPNDNLFYQITLGVELKSVDWDFRLNGYIPINPDGGSVNKNSNADIHINGNTIKMTTESRDEKALYGFDGEVGWRVPVFPADGDVDIRVYAGGYYFTNGDVDTIAGPRGRIEARLYDIDFLGLQSRLTAQGVIQWDQPRGTQGWGGLELRIPLGAITGSPGPKLNPLDRRMVDRVVRDIDIVTEKTQPKTTSEDVIVDELTVSTRTIVFANSAGTGSGAKGSPIDLNQAPGKGQTLGSNAIILADGGAGDITITNPLHLSNGQALIGGGSIVPLTGAKSGKTVDLAFDGTKPTLVGANGGNNLVEMARGSQNEIFGLNLAGSFSNGVYGRNMERAIVKNSTLAGAGGTGIFLYDRSAGGLSIPTSQFVDIAGNSMVGEGIEIRGLLSDGATHIQTIRITGNTVTSGGIEILQNVTSLPSFAQSVLISGNAVTSAGTGLFFSQVDSGLGSFSQTVTIDGNAFGDIATGVFFSQVLTDVAGAANQRVSIDNNTVGSAATGIFFSVVDSRLDSFTQSVDIDGNTIGNVASGVFFSQVLSDVAGAASQDVSIADNTVASAATGIFVSTLDERLGSFSQTVDIDGNTIGSAAAIGIQFGQNLLDVTGAANTNLSVSGNSVAIADTYGIAVRIDATSLGSLSQNIGIDGNTIGTAAGQAIRLVEGLSSTTGGFSQVVDIGRNAIGTAGTGIDFAQNLIDFAGAVNSNVSIYGNAMTSVAVGIFFSGVNDGLASFSQSVGIDRNTFGGNVATGIFFSQILADVAGAATQEVSINDNAAASAATGIFFSVIDDRLGSFSQGVDIERNTFGTVAASGVFFSQILTDVAGAASQNVTIDDNAVGSAATGIVFSVLDERFGSFSQSVAIDGNTIGSAGTGIFLAQTLYGVAGAASQNVSLDDNVVATAGGTGISFAVFASHLGSFSQSVDASGNTVGTAGGNGIFVGSTLTDVANQVRSTLSITGNSVTSAGATAIYLSQAIGDATVSQVVAIDSNSVTVAGKNGIGSVLTVAPGGSLTQAGKVDGNVVTGATSNGVFFSASAAGGGGGIANLNLSLSHNVISSNGGNGFAGNANGAGVTEVFTLVSGSGNHLNANGGAGVYLSNLGGSITFHINGNDLAGNTGGTTATAGTVTITP